MVAPSIRSTALVVALVLVALGAWFGRHVPFAEQWPLYEALRTTAAIIFAIIGAWLAIIYPERLKFSFRGRNGTVGESDSASSELFTPVINSTCILSIVLVLGVVAPIAKRLDLPGDVAIWRAVSYGLLVALTLWQLWTILLTFGPADRVKSSMDSEKQRADTIAAVKGNANRSSP